ncbi:putative nucleotide deaminase [Halobacteriovorax marinus SJ]|uniref:tRNA-specific adenosine deaminase n=1 Tax=Halobacteriovorax marinus (strain ATCC BAA-682 / DSM 15412 / SJ) TaxID=862908 RepID=E1X1R9_HALMS|nr:nucleoside deaminase [Halobacteriovorax marinus]CBW24988.1 putative nucleotide deaminase [Halobacteriovorax marinus SJ]
MHNFSEYKWLMSVAMDEAYKAYSIDEVPIGAAIVDESGNILSQCHNEKEHCNDPCGHAEIIAIREACKKRGDWRLSGCTIYVTLEPCPMCLSAMIQARVDKLVFAAYDPKGGAISLNYNLYKDKRLNHNFSVVGGIGHFESSKVLSRFFREKRSSYKK